MPFNQDLFDFLFAPTQALNSQGEEVHMPIVDDASYNSLDLGHNNLENNDDETLTEEDISNLIDLLLEDDTYIFDFIELDDDNHNTGNNGVSRVELANQVSIQNLERIRIHENPEQSSDLMCSICLEEFLIGTITIRLPHPCYHIFHEHCITRWLNMNNTCPLCRRTI
ncbi:NEP1-interacting protein-like 1 [Glycine max]|nr:NEP1-interacting protein-like 1 [Glycine max]